MNRLVKAEWYRLTHSNRFILWALFVSAAAAGIALLSANIDAGASDVKMTVSFYFLNLLNNTGELFMMFILILCAVIVSFGYVNKTGLYDVMAGNKISHILLSRVIVVGGSSFVIFNAFILTPIVVLACINGKGDISNLTLRIGLLMCCMLHYSVIGVLMVTAFRSAIGGVVAFCWIYILMLLGMTCNDLVSTMDMSRDVVRKILSVFPTNQLMYLSEPKVEGYVIVSIILTTLADALFWYIISYAGYRKKKFR